MSETPTTGEPMDEPTRANDLEETLTNGPPQNVSPNLSKGNDTSEQSEANSEPTVDDGIPESANEMVERGKALVLKAQKIINASSSLINPGSLIALLVAAILFLTYISVSAFISTVGPNENACKTASDCEVAKVVARDCGSPLSAVTGGTIANTYTLGGSNKERQQNLLVELQTRLGLTKAQAAGIVGNLMVESGSGLNPAALNGSSGAFGWVQWLGGRKTNFESFRSQNGYPSPPNDAANLAFLVYEVTKGTESGGFNSFKSNGAASADPVMAAVLWDRYYERSGEHSNGQKNGNKRELNAKAVYAGQEVGGAGPGETVAVAANDGCSTSYASSCGEDCTSMLKAAKQAVGDCDGHPPTGGSVGGSYYNQCLGFVQIISDAAGYSVGCRGLGSALGAYNCVRDHRKGTVVTDWATVPAGAVILRKGGTYGHAMVSAGNGKVITTYTAGTPGRDCVYEIDGSQTQGSYPLDYFLWINPKDLS